MKYFSVPSDFKKSTIDRFEKINQTYEDSRIIETYGNITIGNFFQSGRSIELLPQVDFDHLYSYVQYSQKKHIDFHYTINASHMQNMEFTPKGILEIMNFLEKLYDIGIRSLTIALPSIMQIVTHMKQDFKIKASVICQITNANKALFYKDMGIERIVADESINRDFEELRKIRNTFGEKVEVIVNPVCNKNCTYRMFHYNQISSDSVKVTSTASSNYYVHRCLLRRYSSVGNLLRIAFIRPEDIKYYTAIGINYFKLQGRDTLHQGDICRAVEYYCKESYDGNLMELIDIFGANSSFNVKIDNKKLDGFLKPFFEIKGHCKDDCDNCHYCDTYARKCIDVKTAQKVYNDAKKFYSQYDEFNRILSETIFGSQENFQDEKSIEIDFDMG